MATFKWLKSQINGILLRYFQQRWLSIEPDFFHRDWTLGYRCKWDSSYKKKWKSFFLINYLHCLYVLAWLKWFPKEATTIDRRYAYLLLWRDARTCSHRSHRSLAIQTHTHTHTGTNVTSFSLNPCAATWLRLVACVLVWNDVCVQRFVYFRGILKELVCEACYDIAAAILFYI